MCSSDESFRSGVQLEIKQFNIFNNKIKNNVPRIFSFLIIKFVHYFI